jgi:hypothetical protein
VVNQINNDQSKNDLIASMHEAVSKKVNFDCATWKVKATEVLKLTDTKLPLGALHTVAKAIGNKTMKCEATCDKNHLCRVTSSLFDLFLKDKDLPLAGKAHDYICAVLCNRFFYHNAATLLITIMSLRVMIFLWYTCIDIYFLKVVNILSDQPD